MYVCSSTSALQRVRLPGTLLGASPWPLPLSAASASHSATGAASSPYSPPDTTAVLWPASQAAPCSSAPFTTPSAQASTDPISIQGSAPAAARAGRPRAPSQRCAAAAAPPARGPGPCAPRPPPRPPPRPGAARGLGCTSSPARPPPPPRSGTAPPRACGARSPVVGALLAWTRAVRLPGATLATADGAAARQQHATAATSPRNHAAGSPQNARHSSRQRLKQAPALATRLRLGAGRPSGSCASTACAAASAKSASASVTRAGASAHRSRRAGAGGAPGSAAPAAARPLRPAAAAGLAGALRLGAGGRTTGRAVLAAAATTSQRRGLSTRRRGCRDAPLFAAAACASSRPCRGHPKLSGKTVPAVPSAACAGAHGVPSRRRTLSTKKSSLSARTSTAVLCRSSCVRSSSARSVCTRTPRCEAVGTPPVLRPD
jgi:hypothetical protein